MGLDGCGNGMMERREGNAGWKGEWDEGERRVQGWIYAVVK